MQLVDKIAVALATMHSGDSIHGDLTTSNMMIKPRLPLDKQMAAESCKLTAQQIAESGDIGDLVSFWDLLNTPISLLFGLLTDLDV